MHSELLPYLYRTSNSLESFKQRVLDNEYHRSSATSSAHGFPLDQLLKQMIDDEESKDKVIELLSAMFNQQRRYIEPFVRERMEKRIERFIEVYYAQCLYTDMFEYQRAYEYEEKLAA